MESEDGTEQLTFEERRLIPINPEKYAWKWICLTRYTFSKKRGPQDLLAMLLRTPAYSGFGYEIPPDTELFDIHGPFLLSKISVDEFQPISPATGMEQLQAWLRRAEATPSSLSVVADAFDGLIMSAVLYRLPDLGSAAELPFGRIAGRDFLEFVAFDESERAVTVMLAADD